MSEATRTTTQEGPTAGPDTVREHPGDAAVRNPSLEQGAAGLDAASPRTRKRRIT